MQTCSATTASDDSVGIISSASESPSTHMSSIRTTTEAAKHIKLRIRTHIRRSSSTMVSI